ncbi:MAG: hypothetical protein ACOCUW_00260 [Gemmatimonadota bacterium]
MKKRSVVRSLVAGALIGFADAAPLDPARLRRPLGVVWLDDRDLPDPLAGVPLLVLDPVVPTGSADTRRRVGRALRLGFARPLRLLDRLRAHLAAD